MGFFTRHRVRTLLLPPGPGLVLVRTWVSRLLIDCLGPLPLQAFSPRLRIRGRGSRGCGCCISVEARWPASVPVPVGAYDRRDHPHSGLDRSISRALGEHGGTTAGIDPYTLHGYLPVYASNSIGTYGGLLAIMSLPFIGNSIELRKYHRVCVAVGITTLLATQYRTGIVAFLVVPFCSPEEAASFLRASSWQSFSACSWLGTRNRR